MSNLPVGSLPSCLSMLPGLSPQEIANVARVRDSQRRSRARRKEYLQELGARLRKCELHGIEASAEIQVAARKVADENRKLRGLLALHSVGKDDIEAYLHCYPTSDLQSSSQIPGHGAPLQNLQQLLQTRKPCNFQMQTSHTVGTDGAGNREASLRSISTAQSSWDLNSMPFSGVHQTGNSYQFMTPMSAARSTASSINFRSHYNVPEHQGSASISASRNYSPPSKAKQSQMSELGPRLSQSDTAQPTTHQAVPQHLQSQDTF